MTNYSEMTDYREIMELYFDKDGVSKLSREDLQMPFLRETLLNLYHYLQASKDCTPLQFHNIEKFLTQNGILINDSSQSPFHDKIRELEQLNAQLNKNVKKNKNTPKSGSYSYLLAHDPFDSSDDYYSDFNDKTSRNVIIKKFLSNVKELSLSKTALTSDELTHIQNLTMDTLNATVEAEHIDEAKDLMQFVASGKLETESCPIQNKTELLKSSLTNMVNYYAIQGNTPSRTGNSKRDREQDRSNKRTAHYYVDNLMTEASSGKFGEEIKSDRDFCLGLDKQFHNHGRDSDSYSSGIFD